MSTIEYKLNDPLSARESQVLAAIVAGRASKEIARDLGISPRTIEVHRIHIREKLGARNTADIVRIAMTRAMKTESVSG